ncbi:MAG: hypothetical protein J0H43_16070 [Actinobacteria bacterium]|nr:hypothetical protein [Actinomycetota bacterium]
MRILAAAAQVSISLGAEEISSSHVLVALTETPGALADSLAVAGADANAVTQSMNEDADRWPRTPAGFVPFSDVTQRIRDLAPQLAWEDGRAEATDTDLLAAIAEVPASSAMRTLSRLGLHGDDVRRIARSAGQDGR